MQTSKGVYFTYMGRRNPLTDYVEKLKILFGYVKFVNQTKVKKINQRCRWQ